MENKKPTYEEVVENLSAYYGVVDFLRSLKPKPNIKFEGEPGTGKTLTVNSALANLPELKMIQEDDPDIPPPPVCPVRAYKYENCFDGRIERALLHPIERLAYDMWLEQYSSWCKQYIDIKAERFVGISSFYWLLMKAKLDKLEEEHGEVVVIIDEVDSFPAVSD